MPGRTIPTSSAALLAVACLGCVPGDAASGGERTERAAGPIAATHRAERPPSVGLDSTLIADALRRAAALPRLRALVIARHGDILVERRFRGPALDAPVNVKSVSKSVLSALVGIAIAERHLTGVDQPIAPFFERQLGADADPRKRRIEVGHLLSMQSGLERTSGAHYGAWVMSRDWVRYAIRRPMIAEPGGPRIYSTGNSHLLSAVLTDATGQSTWAYARSRLAEPLGIALPRWPADPQGIFFGGNEMRLSPRGLVRFGELYRNAGRYDGRQIVPESWVRESLVPRAQAWRRDEGYGYGWFLGRVRGHAMFYAQGYGGQFLFVVPGLELTVVMTADPDSPRERDHLAASRRLFADWIVPAAEAGAASIGAS
jgi:CubicO group peptidase (beta-lactamase class C family)